MWGLVLSTKLIRRRGLPAWLLDLHTFLGTLSMVFCGIHLAALALDGYTEWGWKDLLVPMATRWHPGATAWGIVAMYLLVAVEVTSWLRKRLPKRIWHRVHLASFALFVTGTIHGITAGSDWSNRVVVDGTIAVSALVLTLTVIRFTAKRRRPRVTGTAATAAAPARRGRSGHGEVDDHRQVIGQPVPLRAGSGPVGIRAVGHPRTGH